MAKLMEPKVRLLSRSISLIIASSIAGSVHAEPFSDIPAVSTTVKDTPYFKLYLELVVNTYSSQKLIPVIVKDDQYFIPRKDLADLKIDYAGFTTESGLKDEDIVQLGFNDHAADWVKLQKEGEGYRVGYNSLNQQLLLTLPGQWLPEQMLGRDYWYERTTAKSGTGLLNNYDMYYSRPHQGKSAFNVYTEQRFFSPYGAFVNSGLYSSLESESNQINADDARDSGYVRYDTSWRYDNENSIATVELGDIYTYSKNSWASSIRLGGIQLRKNFSIRPDLITYPLPQFKGEVALPSTVDLFINGTKNSTDQLQPGPFLINNVPFINGRGEAVIITTDAVGRQISTSVPFYVSGELLKKGLLDYSMSAGALRENYGVKSFDYGDFAASMDVRYGLRSWLTAEGHAEGNDKIWNAGAGTAVQLYNYGVLNTSYTLSSVEESSDPSRKAEGQGHQLTVGY